jgi:hypothetical protein
MKGRLLLASALFVFVQIPTQAQVTVDVSKITCEEYLTDTITFSQYVVMWLSGYYNASRRLTYTATNTAKRPSWMPSRTCSALINEFTQHSQIRHAHGHSTDVIGGGAGHEKTASKT